MIIIIISWHNENSGIVRTVYSGVSGIFRDNQQYSVMFRHAEGGTLRHI